MNFEEWLTRNHPHYKNLTDAVVSITTSLLTAHNVPYLFVSGRTKPEIDCLTKAKRKRYKEPSQEMTDISGVRVVLYFEHDVDVVSEIIKNSFNVDTANSSNKDDLLSVNQFGYRSIHFVCDLGSDRSGLPEHANLGGRKFELQVRTVLQHAWAELSHDRSYKFTGKLPKRLERKLYRLASQLEAVDEGFSELSQGIDRYLKEVSESTAKGSLKIELNSLSLYEFVKQWAESNNFELEEIHRSANLKELIDELNVYGVYNLEQLKNIIPEKYSDNFAESNIFGVVRDWMMLHDTEQFVKKVHPPWTLEQESLSDYSKYLTAEEIEMLIEKFEMNFNEVDED